MSSISIPKARDDDPEDVSWALSTAATSLARGDRVEALKWLRRAAEAASEAERDTRALELAKAAAELSTMGGIPISPSRPPPAPPSRPPPPTPSRPPPLASRPPPPAPSRPPPPAPSRPPPPTPSRPPPLRSAPSVTPRTPEVKTKPPTPAAKTTKSPAKGKADETGKRAARKSVTSEAQRARTSSTSDDTQPHEITSVRPPMKTPAAALVGATEADAWPTETSDPTTAENPQYGQERTRIGSPAYKPDKAKAVATQAVRVVIWRAPDGSLRVSPHGTSVSAVTMEAMLVAVEPDADLLAWLAPP